MTDPTPQGAAAPPPIELRIPPGAAGERLDKALAALAPPGAGLSRSRIRALIGAGAVARVSDGAEVLDHRVKVKPGEVWRLAPPPPEPATPEAEAIPLTVAFEDAHLIVVDKAAGMVAHPAPGAPSGTLVNALLAHCAGGLSGVGGVARPGIVHRIDKDTSGLIVAAKTDAAHQGLAALFAAHEVERSYLAICRGAPDAGDPRVRGLPGVSARPGGWLRVETRIDRHRADRKRMAVVASGGRLAATNLRALERFGPAAKPAAAVLECRLETGRTHQIRVHAGWLGHPLIGDPVYGRGRAAPAGLSDAARAAVEAFPRQALHAAVLGFVHPATGARLRFETSPPPDMAALLAALRG